LQEFRSSGVQELQNRRTTLFEEEQNSGGRSQEHPKGEARADLRSNWRSPDLAFAENSGALECWSGESLDIWD
jgi:hypothetical protein